MKPLHILVALRDAGQQEELAAAFRRAGHTMLVAESAGAAAESLGTDVDAVLLDLRLPDLNLPELRRLLSAGSTSDPDSLKAAERRHLLRVLLHTGGNKRQAAHILGISRSTLLNKVRKYGLDHR